MVQGDTLVVHRRNSQDLIQPYGTGFKAAHNESGIGFWPRSMMENIPTGHIGWTRYGPGLFNQEGMTVMFPEIERMLAAFNQSQRMNPRLRGVIHDQNRRRVYFLLGWEAVGIRRYSDGVRHPADHPAPGRQRHESQSLLLPTRPGTRAARSSSSTTRRNEAWLEDYAGLCGGGDHLGQMYFFRYDGTVVEHPTGWSGKDFDVARINAATPVDGMVETQWMNHGSEQRKMLQKIYLTLRALDVNEDVDEILGRQVRSASESATSGTRRPTRCTSAPSRSWPTTGTTCRRAPTSRSWSSDMLSRSLEGNRMLPVMLFTITLAWRESVQVPLQDGPFADRCRSGAEGGARSVWWTR